LGFDLVADGHRSDALWDHYTKKGGPKTSQWTV
jgi:hypothetical protein